MSVIISPVITNAGLSVFTPSATGIEFTFTHVAVGTGTSAASSADTALEHEIARFPIAGGGMVTGGHAVSINALITNHQNANPQNYAISEFGFYGIDGANNTILFAIHRQSTAIVSKVSGADISAPFVMGLAALPVNNMTVQIDTNASAMLALLGQHTASNHPHTQYKRTLDNTERLKIASAVEADEAIRKDELDALRLRLIANGIDANLGVTNHIPNINVDSFLIPEGFFDENTLGDKPFTYGLCKTWKEDNGVVYQFAQSYEAGEIATRLYRSAVGYWTTWRYYASLNGDSNQFFYVKAATDDNHAPTYKQLVDGDNAEATARTNADLALAIAIAAEITNRQNGDSNLQTQINNLILQIMSKAWPIGSVYENEVDMRNPAHEDLLGFGTWIPTQYGRFSVGYADTDSQFGGLGWAGGNRNHKMTLDNLIEHQVKLPISDEINPSVAAVYGEIGDQPSLEVENFSIGVTSSRRHLSAPVGSPDPDPIPTLPPYVVSAKWRRTA